MATGKVYSRNVKAKIAAQYSGVETDITSQEDEKIFVTKNLIGKLPEFESISEEQFFQSNAVTFYVAAKDQLLSGIPNDKKNYALATIN